MSPITISEKWRSNYNNYYQPEMSAWRWIGSEDKYKNIARLCCGIPRHRVLEIGSGDGAVLKRMDNAAFAEELFSLEISESSRAALESLGLKRLKQAALFDGYSTSFPEKYFDLVVLSHVMEHVEHPRILLQEVKRISHFVFVEVPLEDTWRLPLNYRFDPVGHINFYSKKTIRRLLQTCDLDIVDQIISPGNLDSYKYRLGLWKGTTAYVVKKALLVVPPLATQMFTYHSALLARPS